MQLTAATLFRLWQRADAMERYALPAREVLRISNRHGSQAQSTSDFTYAAEVVVTQAHAWQRTMDWINGRVDDAVSDGACRLMDMTRQTSRFTRTELLADRHLTGLSIRECERFGQREQVPA